MFDAEYEVSNEGKKAPHEIYSEGVSFVALNIDREATFSILALTDVVLLFCFLGSFFIFPAITLSVSCPFLWYHIACSLRVNGM